VVITLEIDLEDDPEGAAELLSDAGVEDPDDDDEVHDYFRSLFDERKYDDYFTEWDASVEEIEIQRK